MFEGLLEGSGCPVPGAYSRGTSLGGFSGRRSGGSSTRRWFFRRVEVFARRGGVFARRVIFSVNPRRDRKRNPYPARENPYPVAQSPTRCEILRDFRGAGESEFLMIWGCSGHRPLPGGGFGGHPPPKRSFPGGARGVSAGGGARSARG